MEWWEEPESLEPDTLEMGEILSRIGFLRTQLEAFPAMPKAGEYRAMLRMLKREARMRGPA